MNMRGMFFGRAGFFGLWLLSLTLLLAGCGGDNSSSGGGSFVSDNPAFSVSIRTSDRNNQVDWNPTLKPSDVRQAYTKTLIAEVRRDGRLFPADELEVRILGSSAGAVGALCVPIPGLPQPDGTIDTGFDPSDVELTAGGPPCEDITLGPLNRVTYRGDGLRRSSTELFFVANNRPGTVQIQVTALVFEEQDGPTRVRNFSDTLNLTVVGQTRPVTSINFTGPFVNAVRAGLTRTAIAPGETVLQDGTYQRVVSVVAADENGNPPLIGTPIDFYLVDGPLVGYPAEGSGSFAISGPDGNPEEGGVIFRVPPVPGGGFSTDVTGGPAVRPFNDRLVLDGRQEQNPNAAINPNNRIFTGLWRVESVLDDNTLTIEQDRALADSRRFPPFPLNPANPDTGATVPYIVGGARHGTILSTALTNDTGVATTLLTYPAVRLGQTAVLLACTRPQDLGEDDRFNDRRVCGILNTCDAAGRNCGSVYLPVNIVDDDELAERNIELIASPTELGPNTTTPLTLCIRDQNFAPIPAGEITYTIPTGLAEATTITINGDTTASGSIVTGASGCATVDVEASGQFPGSEPVVLSFSAEGVSAPVEVSIKGPGAGTLTGMLSCDRLCRTPQRAERIGCTVDMQLTSEVGGVFPDVPVSVVVSPALIVKPQFTPAFGSLGITDERGAVTFRGEFPSDRETNLDFTAAGAPLKITIPQFPEC